MKSRAGIGFKVLLTVMTLAGVALAFVAGLVDGSGAQSATAVDRPALRIEAVVTQVAMARTESDAQPKPWVLLLAGGAVVAWVALRRSAAR